MEKNKTNKEAETIEPDLQLEYTLDGQLTEVRDKEAKQNTKPISSYLETWAGNFGTSKDRKRGKRELLFIESLDDMAEQVSCCLEALAVMSETMVTEGWRGGIADGFCIISALVCESAIKTIKALDAELKSADRQNKKLREELSRKQARVRA